MTDDTFQLTCISIGCVFALISGLFTTRLRPELRGIIALLCVLLIGKGLDYCGSALGVDGTGSHSAERTTH